MKPPELVIRAEPIGRKGTVMLAVRLGNETLAVEKLDGSRSTARERFATRLTEDNPGLDQVEIKRELLDIAGDILAKPEPEDGPADPLAKTSADTKAAALAMLRYPELIRHVVDDVGTLGVTGEKMLAATIYVVGTSRLLAKPLAAIVQGLTCSGKSYVNDAVAKLFPPESVIRAHKMTPEALVHLPHGALEHRFIVGGERSRRQDDDTADATRALREMLSDGRLTKLIPMKVPGGKGLETVQTDQPGPIAYVESTTLQSILDEDRNRCLVLATDETPEQTRRIITLLAERKANPGAAATVVEILDKHRTAQRMLCQCSVVIPFANRLGKHFPSERTDARRAFGHLLSMVEAVTLLHQFQRTDEPAADVTISATADDYRLARKLLAGPFARALGDGLSDAARWFGERLAKAFAGVEFDTRDIAKGERVIGDKQTIRQYVRALAVAGILEQTVPRQGPKPARYRLAERSADDATAAGLPDVTEIFDDA